MFNIIFLLTQYPVHLQIVGCGLIAHKVPCPTGLAPNVIFCTQQHALGIRLFSKKQTEKSENKTHVWPDIILHTCCWFPHLKTSNMKFLLKAFKKRRLESSQVATLGVLVGFRWEEVPLRCEWLIIFMRFFRGEVVKLPGHMLWKLKVIIACAQILKHARCHTIEALITVAGCGCSVVL